ncbi:MAG: serine/threonine protein kinase [Nannocystaceae bacterium]|nr:serine/threonine protein kinase [Nannocystaceae bacterium]
MSRDQNTRTDGAPFSKLGAAPEDDSLEAARAQAAVESRMFGAIFAPAPVHVGRFEIRERVGRGGMGLVYSASDPELGRIVAIKVVRPEVSDDDSGAKLLEEAKTLARISHPNVVTILDAGRTGERVWIAMEFVDSTLALWLETRPARAKIFAAFEQAGRGLAAAHEAGLVHRDFKPSNVLRRSNGQAVVADFGLARRTDEGDVRGCAGTLFYMSPEQHGGEPVDARSDQYSWCVALHEALFGDPPFRGDTLADRQATSAQGKHNGGRERDLRPGMLAALRRGLSHRPEERYPDMNALLDAVFLEPQRRARRRVLIGIGGGLLCLGAAVLIILPNPAPRDPCGTSATAVDETWNDGRREAIRIAFTASGVGDRSDRRASRHRDHRQLRRAVDRPSARCLPGGPRRARRKRGHV